ncbi:MAG: hypothetical protein GY946_04525 [bacterium]|nr:hypothetical protein [bacterium]
MIASITACAGAVGVPSPGAPAWLSRSASISARDMMPLSVRRLRKSSIVSDMGIAGLMGALVGGVHRTGTRGRGLGALDIWRAGAYDAHMSEEPDEEEAGTATVAAAQTAAERFAGEFKLGVRRIAEGDFQQIKASDEERAELLAASRPVEQPLAQDYAAWRKSILMISSALLVVAALFKVINFQSFETVFVEPQVPIAIEAAKQQGRNVSEEEARAYLVQRLGPENLETGNLLFIMDLSVILLAALLVVLAARSWARIRASRRMARRAWYVWMLLPIAMALIPWSAILDFSHLPAPEAKQIRMSIGVVLGLAMVFILGPKFVTIFPGVIRSGLILKTLVPETGHSIWAAVICAPVFVLMLILSVATVLQVQGDALLLFATLCFVLAPISYLRHAKTLMQPMEGPAAAALVGQVRKSGYVLNAIGAVLLIIFVLKHELVTWDGAITLVATALGGLFLMMVVTSDFLLALLHVSFQQAGELYGTKKAKELEAKLGALSAGGLTELLTPAEELEDAQTPKTTGEPDA